MNVATARTKALKFVIIHNHPIHYKHLLFREMKRRDLDFEVLFAAGRSAVRHEETCLSHDLYPYRIGYEGPYESAPVGKRIQFTWCSLNKLRPSVVVIGGYHTPEGWAAWFWAILHRRKVVLWYESNEFDFKRAWYKELPKQLFVRRCACAHVYGMSHKSYLVKLGIPSDRVILKRSVANVEEFSTPAQGRSYSGEGRKHLVYVGRLAAEKNLSIVLRALAAVSSGSDYLNLRLSVVGTGPLEQELRRECLALGIQSLVDFKGYCPQSKLPALLRTMDFLVLPSTREPWGLVAVEAMLCRVPVIVSTQCGCAEDIVTRETGWKFSPWNESELASLLMRLPAISAKMQEEMGEACHRLASDHSAAKCARRVAESLQRLSMGGPDHF